MKRTTIRQRGLAIISAIVILVIFAGLGAVALTFSTAQHVGSAQDLLGARALYAARSGLEWGAYQITVAQGYPTPPTATNPLPPNCFASPSTVVMPAATLSMFTVTVTCVRSGDAAFGRPTPVFMVTATACNEPSGGSCPNTTNPSTMYVERQVEQLF